MVPCQNLLKQEGTVRRIDNMQQSSATHSLYILLFGGYRRLLHAVNPPRSAFLFQKFGHGTLPTSYLNFILVGKKPAHIDHTVQALC